MSFGRTVSQLRFEKVVFSSAGSILSNAAVSPSKHGNLSSNQLRNGTICVHAAHGTFKSPRLPLSLVSSWVPPYAACRDHLIACEKRCLEAANTSSGRAGWRRRVSICEGSGSRLPREGEDDIPLDLQLALRHPSASQSLTVQKPGLVNPTVGLLRTVHLAPVRPMR